MTWVPTESELRAMPAHDYMNAAQLAHFRARLLEMHKKVLQEEADARARMKEVELLTDHSDRATLEEQRALDLRMHERRKNLRHKVELALKRIDDGRYGYCEQTGDQIGIARLLARPTAEVSIVVKAQNERVEALYRDVR